MAPIGSVKLFAKVSGSVAAAVGSAEKGRTRLDDYGGMRTFDVGLASSAECKVRLAREMRGYYCHYTRVTREKEGAEPEELIAKQWNGSDIGQISSFIKVLLPQVNSWYSLSHENVVPLLGVFGPQGEARITMFPGIILPYYKNGNAKVYAYDNPSVDLVNILNDILSGLSYIHSIGVVHGELKVSNVFIDDSGRARLSGFGLLRQMTQRLFADGSDSDKLHRWLAPEVLENLDAKNRNHGYMHGIGVGNSPASDVYSFAMTALEIYTGVFPFLEIGDDSAIRASVLNSNLRPKCPSEDIAPALTDSVWKILEDCWATNPDARPTADGVKDRILGIERLQRGTP